jgi:hypothetical protein
MIRYVFSSVKRDASKAQKIIQSLIARKERSKDIKYVLYESNHTANYKGCMIYKDLERNYFPVL